VCLLVRHEAWVAGRESCGMHAENQDIDPVVTLLRRRVERGLCARAFLGVPRPHPRLYALLKFSDDPVREFLYRIAAFGGFGLGGFPCHMSPRQPDFAAAFAEKRGCSIALVAALLVPPRTESQRISDPAQSRKLRVALAPLPAMVFAGDNVERGTDQKSIHASGRWLLAGRGLRFWFRLVRNHEESKFLACVFEVECDAKHIGIGRGPRHADLVQLAVRFIFG
jgi:hypothetical protein